MVSSAPYGAVSEPITATRGAALTIKMVRATMALFPDASASTATCYFFGGLEISLANHSSGIKTARVLTKRKIGAERILATRRL